ncbi:ABC transporter ATP-binding protein [Sediminitomix flava]|uniref:ABC-type multidrug transport system ATPase subunit n=1 Tax=Sediminitomix flava TaxID=379075 RepID=A0A315ZB70_SEDFL|nr:ABC transporter ATP-binding protein [Sediminitomix flava]PWJ41964.1 ABC-type multidrug transport system ATPase subunit [Sediminitomix flava]
MEIKIKDLHKRYDNGYHALKGVNLTIREGMFGLLGPNGAGKSSLMRILTAMMEPSSGLIEVNGLDLNKHRKMVRQYLGYLPQDFRFFASLKSWEFLDYAASLAGMKSKKERSAAVEEMLNAVGLWEFRNRYANKLSGGMKRRLGIAQALIGDPKIVIVDEPTTGLDPDERIRFRNLLTELSHKDVIIILSTHIVGDISSSCNDMGLLNHGHIDFQGSPREFMNMAEGKVWQVEVDQATMNHIQQHFTVVNTMPTVNGWNVQLIADDISNLDAKNITPDLEHAYMYFMEQQEKNTSENSFSSLSS